MKYFDWNTENNERLKKGRGISFEEIVFWIMQGRLLDIIEHRDIQKYPNQKIFVVGTDDYVYLVPFVEDDEVIFLKTIIPSRKMTKKYLGDTDETK